MKKNKRYSKPKQEFKEEGMSSGLLSAIKVTGNEVYGVSANQQTVGSVTDFDITVKDIIIGDQLAESSNALNSLLEGPISELIDAYATARGYVTSVTYTKVSQYVVQSQRMLNLLFHMFRAQNVRNVVTPGGQSIGALLAKRPSVRFSGPKVADYVINTPSEATTTNHIDDGDVSISNSTWASDWLSQLVHMKLSKPLVEYSASLFGTFYQQTQSNGTTLYSFIPETLTSSSGISVFARYDALATSLASMRAADRDLVDILNFLGFTNEEVIQLDFNRDIRKQTLPIIQDPAFLSMFINTNLHGVENNDDDVISLFYDVYGKFTAMNAPDDVQLSADVVFASRVLRGKVFGHHIIKTLNDSGAERILAAYPLPLYLSISDYPSAGQAVFQRLALIKARSMAAGIPELPYSDYSGQVAEVNGSPAINTSIVSYVNEHANVYVLPDTFDFYTLAKKAEMIMGNVNYRKQIQDLSNKIRTSSITKAT